MVCLPMIEPRPDWYKDAVIYEVHVRAFHDSVGDGYGDFRGLTRKLGYLEDLGVNTLWVLPFYPSPQRDDGYDIADYTSVHPQFGTLADFEAFLAEAHRRGLRVVTELVLNHTSDQHPWFQRARRAPRGSAERDFYVWNDTPDKYRGVRIIFQDFEASNWTWDPVAGQYYWHRFYHHQPDLNYDNPAVRDAVLPVVDFWLKMGVDGLRLDAVPYLFEREGTTCENLPETHAFLKSLRKHVDERFPGRMLLAEANQWPEDAVGFFGDGDECHMAFHFPLMPRLFLAVHEENSYPILDILAQTPPIPDSCQWCVFLRNHDELTLEMVTDEERDYMYRAYTRERRARINLGIRHRLAPLLGNDRRRIELLNGLLFSLPGTPVLYYGDEIGMGDNIYLGDRNGVRTPMQWSADRNAGFSRANAQKLYLPVVIDPEYHYEAVNVEAQQNNPNSLLWWTKRLIALRKQHRAFSRGTLDVVKADNPRVLAFVRRYEGESVLVVANLSRFVQPVRLDLAGHAGARPEELFGRNAFPPVGDEPYFLTLAPYAFYWFALRPDGFDGTGGAAPALPTLAGPADGAVADFFQPAGWGAVEAVLPEYLTRSRFSGTADPVTLIEVRDVAHVVADAVDVWFLLARVEHRSGRDETVIVPAAFVPEPATDLLVPVEQAGIARVDGPVPGVLVQPLAVPACARGLLRSLVNGRTFPLGDEAIVARPAEPATARPDDLAALRPAVHVGDEGTVAASYGEAFFLKVFRRLEDGPNPALEVGRFLARQGGRTWVAPLVGWLEYRRRDGDAATLAVLHRYVEHQGTAWQAALDQLSRFFERVAALSPDAAESLTATEGDDLIQDGAEMARRLGAFTAELHRALAAGDGDPAFAPEPFGKLYQRGLYQSLRNLTARVWQRLGQAGDRVPTHLSPAVRGLLGQRDRLTERFALLLDGAFDGARIRTHGNYHLGQLLITGGDFVVSDFEGDPARPLGERRNKRSPLRDVAGMLRSFDYAARSVLLGLASSRGRSQGVIRPEDRPGLEVWARAWSARMGREFADEYARVVASAGLVPASPESRGRLLHVLLLEKALTEIERELDQRPAWLAVPLHGALRLLESPP